MKKRLLSVLMAASMTAALTACGGSAEPSTTAAPEAETPAAGEEAAGDAAETPDLGNFEGQELSVSTFSFNAELLQKNIYDPFMEATGCKLIVEGGKNATYAMFGRPGYEKVKEELDSRPQPEAKYMI